MRKEDILTSWWFIPIFFVISASILLKAFEEGGFLYLSLWGFISFCFMLASTFAIYYLNEKQESYSYLLAIADTAIYVLLACCSRFVFSKSFSPMAGAVGLLLLMFLLSITIIIMLIMFIIAKIKNR